MTIFHKLRTKRLVVPEPAYGPARAEIHYVSVRR